MMILLINNVKQMCLKFTSTSLTLKCVCCANDVQYDALFVTVRGVGQVGDDKFSCTVPPSPVDFV